MASNRIIGDGKWSARPAIYEYGTGYHVFPKGERSDWSRRASLYPASDGKSYVISMDRAALDARPSLDEAFALVVERLEGKAVANG